MPFSYDAKGNLLSDGTRSYSYTAENRLATGGSSNLYYDPLGRLAHLSGSGSNFLYHGGEFIEVETASGPARRFVQGPGSDEPLVWYEGAGINDRRYLHADERGSVVAVSDAGGNAIGINKYDEYGNPAATNIGSFGYTGQVWLPELGLWHYKARMYDPRLGRFLQPDPIGYDDGMNLYGYVGGDPVNFVDPTGLSVDVRVPTMYRADPFSASTIFVTGNRCLVRNCNGGDVLAMNTASHALPGLNKGEFNSTGGGDEQVDSEIVITGRRPKTWLYRQIQALRCSLPSFGFSFSVRGYKGLGGGLVSDIAFDPASGRISGSAGIDVGLGYGGSAEWSYGNSGTVGRNVPNGWSGSVGVNANARYAPVAIGVSTTVIGRDGAGFGGASMGIRPNGTGVTLNGNLGARGGYGGQIAPSCGG